MEQLIQAGKLVATLSEKFKKDAKWTLAAARAITQITTAERSVIFASSEGRQLELLNELANRELAGLRVQSATGAGASTGAPDAEHPRDQQAAPPPSSATTWWPASWLGAVAPTWRARGGEEGSRQQQQQEDSAAGSTMPVSSGPHSAVVASMHAPGATNSLSSSSPSPSQHLSTCRQRRPHRAGPRQAASEGTL
ncbi:hypothetical protein CHLRE_10g466900v5 [Chlamydomonas reinhardtii]|uniref:Uncharacterized protein n=1 Tax=Chlamydomonas reinhardtii TaxID=3055 RepID=A0A2K3DCC2_CHLRE|nr:uncharacterized protein CHLRE_10g466900v5 [Chlamydomonas reinhardtii]PNW78172.1 hypothetical protein CHLRE_10g466900v5 [Chlamydomonas reinhardtii]